jgi:hypothetical protein
LFVLALFMGLRCGELLGPKWDDIDWIERPSTYGATCNVSDLFRGVLCPGLSDRAISTSVGA